MKAVESGNINVVKMLLDAGANPLLADRNNMTALMHAQIMHPTKGIVELISHYIQNQGP